MAAIRCVAPAALIVLSLNPVVPAAAEQAADAGRVHLQLRYRYETVDQDGFARDAHASTLRARLGYTTPEYGIWQGLIEFDHVAELLADHFNSGAGTSPSRTRYPVIADPTGSDLNQVYLQAAPSETLRLRVGRQRLIFDNQRFVGGVGWRQNEQTYDAFGVRYTGFENTTLEYAYAANVNRIFGDDVPAGDHDHDSHLINASVVLSDTWTLGAYGYLIDSDDAPAFSTDTFGARLQGSLDVAGGLQLHLELASQSDGGGAPVDFDATYIRADARVQVAENWSINAGVEILAGDRDAPGQAFRTPLATLHAFNGWADKFLATPDAGLEDVFVGGRIRWSGWQLDAVYHDFSAEDGGVDYGSEIDLALARKIGKRYSLLVKYASFNADAASFSDTRKAWLMLTAAVR